MIDFVDAYSLFKHCRCECCGERPSHQRHHVFSNTKWARKRYGKLLDDMRNIQWVCSTCHVSHANSKLQKMTEREFCEKLEIEYKGK